MTDGDGNIQYFDWVEYPHARVRVELETERGVPIRFVIQLERRVGGEWRQVVRFDHDGGADGGHDITEEGLHMDVYRNGEKIRVKDDFPPVHLTHAPRYCTLYIEQYAEQLLRRFDQWHDLNHPTTN